MQHCWQQCFCVLSHGSLILRSLILLFLSDRFTSLHTFKITFLGWQWNGLSRLKDRKTATVLFQSKKEKEIFCARLLPTMMMFKFKRNTGKNIFILLNFKMEVVITQRERISASPVDDGNSQIAEGWH